MSTAPVPPTEKDPAGHDSRRNFPLGVLLLAFGMLTARWIWIAGISDHGWIYEVGMRVWAGEIPYRDFICALPQLTSYTIVPLLALLDGSVWAVQIHLYLWWLTSLVVGLQVVRQLGLSAHVQAAAIFLAACVSFPAICLGHTYSYAGTTFFGLVLLRLLKHQASSKRQDVFLAGVFAGLAMLAKQNIGAVAGLLGLLALLRAGFARQRIRIFAADAATFFVGAAAIFLPAFGYFAFHAGWREVLAQMFFDAGAGKGGPIGMILHTIPLLFFSPATPHRVLWTALVSGVVFLLFLFGFGRRIRAAGRTPKLSADGRAATASDARAPLMISSFAVAFLLVASLWNLPSLKSLFTSLRPGCFHQNQAYVGVLMFGLYSGIVAMSIVCLWRYLSQRRPEIFLPTIALPLLACGHDLSTRGYLPYGAPLVLPLAIFLIERHELVKRPARLACFTGVLAVFIQVAFTQATYNAPTFESIQRLPDQTKFAHLWGAKDYAHSVEVIAANVSPRIRNERTLWIHIGGPHLAFGGQSVRSVALLHSDTYNVRSEPILFEEWNRKLPKFVFVGYYVPCANSRYLNPETLQSWLAEKYDRVFENAECGITLWEVKHRNNPLIN